jgi:hypothetical protein
MRFEYVGGSKKVSEGRKRMQGKDILVQLGGAGAALPGLNESPDLVCQTVIH